MSEPQVRTGRCPSCGANLEFKIGSSRATVCEYCKAVVARAGQDLSLLGKVADLIPTGTRISLGTHGRFEGAAFEVVGRLQYEWEAGVWDEWYLAFGDGRWGWLAEAQGRFYVTFQVPPRPLPSRVAPETVVFIQGLGRFTVTDVKQARIVGAAGELPEPVKLGAEPVTADMESEKGAFATLDLGVPDDENRSTKLYVGRQVDFESLALSGLAPLAEQRQARPAGESLVCPSCHAPVSLRIPEQSVRVTCAHCGALLDCSQGPLRLIEELARGQREPLIPLGAQGTLRGRAFVVAGWMVRSCRVDGIRYPWSEYLLWEEKAQAFAWLVDSDGHWQLATPLSAGAVHVGDDADFNGHRYRHFSSVVGEVELVRGEFYWAVHKGESAMLDDYVAPPEGLSRERGAGEVNWSRLVHLDASEVAEAFHASAAALERPSGVGEIQPWPYEQAWQTISRWTVGGALALLGLVFAFSLRPDTVLVDQRLNPMVLHVDGLDLGDAPDAGEPVRSFISEPFDLTGHEALRVEFNTSVNQSWAYAGGAIINDVSGESSPFGLEASYYWGTSGGEAWSEGTSHVAETLSAPGAGRSLLRADVQWDPQHPPPDMQLRVVTSHFSVPQFFMAMLLLLAWPLSLALQRSTFEKQRWMESNVHPSE